MSLPYAIIDPMFAIIFFKRLDNALFLRYLRSVLKRF